VPDFKAETTQGPIESFHEWKKDKWAVRSGAARAHASCARIADTRSSLIA
jgi:hypothetical protein